MEDIVFAEFLYSKSAKFKAISKIVTLLPNFSVVEKNYRFAITSIRDYCIYQDDINTVIEAVRKWKGSRVLLYGKPYRTSQDYYFFIERLRSSAGKYQKVIERNPSNVSIGSITMENLPLPVVYYPPLYGAFFAFSDDVDGDFYFCECERKAINNYLKLKEQQPPQNYDTSKSYPLGSGTFPPYVAEQSAHWHGDLQSHIKYKKNLCFRCNHKVPKKTYCLPMYGGQFKQHYGWYIQQEYFNCGIDRLHINRMNVLPDQCSPEIYDGVKRISELMRLENGNDNIHSEFREAYVSFEQAMENSVREQFGFKKIGDAWVGETILYKIVCSIFPNEEVIRHFRPNWLEGLELDIYLPQRKLGLEYQGIQHFKPVDHWGGQEKLLVQQEHDMRKKKLCESLNVKLICVDYDEPLNQDYIAQKVKF